MYVRFTVSTEECWWLLMRVRIQFKSRMFKYHADQTTITIHMDIVLLFLIFDDIPIDAQFEIVLRESLPFETKTDSVRCSLINQASK